MIEEDDAGLNFATVSRVQPQPVTSGEEEEVGPRVYLKSDGTIDYLALALDAAVPLIWNGYVIFLQAKKIPGGVNGLISDSITPEAALQGFMSALNTIKETLNAARSS